MSDKIDKKEAAAGLQYIKRFLIPIAAQEYTEDWEPRAREMLESIHRIDADVPILGPGMTDLLFYKSTIFNHFKNKYEIIFRIGKYNNKPVVSYYHNLGESKWYSINETPDKSILRRIKESFGWEGKDENPVSPITKIEEAEALQFIRNVAIPYTADKIYVTFLAFHPKESSDFPKITVEILKNNLRKVRQDLNTIEYESKISKRVWFVYYIQKFSFGLRVVIHHQLPMTTTQKTNNVVLYLDPAKQPSWFQKLGYIKEAHNLNETLMGPDEKSDVTKREEAQAVQWIRDHIFKYVAKQISSTEQQLRDTFKKVGHTNEIWYTSQTGLPNFPEVVYGIYRDEKNRIMVSVDNEPGWHIDFPVGHPEYLADFSRVNENQLPSDPKFNLSKIEEAQALQYIRFLIPKVTKELNEYIASEESGIKFHVDRLTTEKSISKNLKKTVHRKQTFSSRRGPQDYIEYTSKEIGRPDVVFYIYKTDRNHRTLHIRTSPIVAVGYKHFDKNIAGGGTTSHLNESVNQVHRISKKEELEALQYIRRVLGPAAVNAWNNRTVDIQFEPETVMKQLKKIEDYRPPDDLTLAKHNTDYITYCVTIPVRDLTLNHKVFFNFTIYKNKDDKVVIRYTTPLIDGGPYLVGSSPMTGLIPPIHENKNPNPHKAISKMDEYRAVDFIKKLIIPLAVKRWNRIYTPHGDIDVDVVRRTMKKISHETWPRVISDFVVYVSPAKVGINFHWEIWKDGNGKLMVGWKFDNATNLWNIYFVDGPSPIDESFEFLDPKKLALTYNITKKEEMYAADFIKKRLIPPLVEYINYDNVHFTKHRKISVEEVLKTFKKIGSWDSKYGYKREIQYQALFLGEPFLFDIFKDSNGKLQVLQKSDGTTHFVK